MNPLIKDLVEQAKKSVPPGLGPEQWLEVYHIKFSELIVVKCANIIWHEADIKDSAEINEGGYKILEHFGIDWTTK